MIVLHLLTYDYAGVFSKVNVDFSLAPFSLNTIFFASLLLSSRLENNYKSFVILYFSLAVFTFENYFRRLLLQASYMWYATLAVVIVIVNSILMITISEPGMFFYLIV
jgi:hypothetical protein